jgi:hypothetical protein
VAVAALTAMRIRSGLEIFTMVNTNPKKDKPPKNHARTSLVPTCGTSKSRHASAATPSSLTRHGRRKKYNKMKKYALSSPLILSIIIMS